nr:beta-galactosidase 15-like [Ipomoea batatas]
MACPEFSSQGLFIIPEAPPRGFPVWLHNLPGVHELRTANEVYMNAMQNFTTLIVDMVKKEKLFASQGGPIILAQIENEYGNVYEPYGAAGKAYLDWCAKFADSLHTGVPWLMCQQKDAPDPMLETCNGWYCHQYKPRNPTTPKMWTENWTGWFKNWGGKDPLRTAEDVAFAVARFFQTGGTFQNYYMTNVMVKDSNRAEQEPSSLKWSWRPEKIDDTVVLGKGDFSANKIFDQKITNDVSDYLWYMTSVNLDKDDPIWSNDMSIRINNTGHPFHLYVNGHFIGSNWTTYGIPKSVFETKVKFRHGKNQISILSAAVGLQNYGSFFDLAGTGLSGGPVEILGRKGDETISKDISSHKWSYKVGLHGEANKLFSNQSRFASQWQSDKLPINSRMTWYKEIGGTPANVSFHTVRVGSVCANAYENKVIEISCHGRPISGVKYAHFGETQGLCGSFKKGSCGGAKDALTILKTACEGKKSCSVAATEDVFGETNCDGQQSKKLVVEAVC